MKLCINVWNWVIKFETTFMDHEVKFVTPKYLSDSIFFVKYWWLLWVWVPIFSITLIAGLDPKPKFSLIYRRTKMCPKRLMVLILVELIIASKLSLWLLCKRVNNDVKQPLDCMPLSALFGTKLLKYFATNIAFADQ